MGLSPSPFSSPSNARVFTVYLSFDIYFNAIVVLYFHFVISFESQQYMKWMNHNLQATKAVHTTTQPKPHCFNLPNLCEIRPKHWTTIHPPNLCLVSAYVVKNTKHAKWSLLIATYLDGHQPYYSRFDFQAFMLWTSGWAELKIQATFISGHALPDPHISLLRHSFRKKKKKYA